MVIKKNEYLNYYETYSHLPANRVQEQSHPDLQFKQERGHNTRPHPVIELDEIC